MRAEILSVDYAPDDLYGQVPFGAEVIRELPGPDRPDYWLAKLDRPISFAKDGREREVRWIVLSARYVGKVIRPNVGRVTIGLAYVMDEAQADLPSLELS